MIKTIKKQIDYIEFKEVICDKCGKKMFETGAINPTQPPKIQYQCKNCNRLEYYDVADVETRTVFKNTKNNKNVKRK